jgi:tetratricopeptide (TPR) repeat protein
MDQQGKSLGDVLIPLGLAALVAAVYWPVGGYGFVDFDDALYVAANPQVRAGLTWEGLAWAFTSRHAANWHPLTWLSHMADVALFGLDAGWHHRVNVAWHAAGTALLCTWLRLATGSTFRSALVAALFGLHPLHVESVAWVSERKDVLAAFFWMLALLAYGWYARRPGPGRHLAVAAAFAGSLLAKPMAVTLPVVLLLVDVWPLGRLRPGSLSLAACWPLVREKLPLLGLSALSSWITLAAQGSGGTVWPVAQIPLSLRLANAATSAAAYVAKALWPSSLAVFYPHPAAGTGIARWHLLVSTGALLALSALALWQWRRRPFLAAGWAWYLVTLLPVLGIVQVGGQAMADRYTYLPLVGIFFGAAWALPDARRLAPVPRWLLGGALALLVLAAAAAARRQVETWRDSLTLFRHAAEVTPGNWLASTKIGAQHYLRREYAEAVRAFEASLQALPTFDAWMNLAASHAALGQRAEEAAALEEALRLRPDDPEALLHLGLAEARQGSRERVAEVLRRLWRVDPGRAARLVGLVGEGAAGPDSDR